MNKYDNYCQTLKSNLLKSSSPEKAEASRRYFPNGIHCIGANAADIADIIKQFQIQNTELCPRNTLNITEQLLKTAEYSEEVLIAFGLINKYVKNHYDDDLLDRFEFWLEHYASNWSHVDDLCIKTIYRFFLGRPHLITKVQHWAYSSNPWCRRASNVALVKFIKRDIGKSIYYLDEDIVFRQCELLLNDKDEFVQKSVGWLLKVTSIQHEASVIRYIEELGSIMPRSTLRYAIEKMPIDTRKYLLAANKKA